MAPDNYQQAWQAQSSQTRVTVDADLLLQEAQRHGRDFRTMTAVHDYGYIVIELLAVPTFIYMGVVTAAPWTWYLMVLVSFWSIGYTLVFRARHKRPSNDPGEPLLSCVKEVLVLVERQILWQRSVHWWIVLPAFAVILVFLAHLFFRLASGDWWVGLGVTAFFSIVLLAQFYVGYYLTNRHLASKYEPQRQELLMLLASLRDETAGESADDSAAASVSPFSEMRRMTPIMSPARMAIAFLGLALLMLLYMLLVLLMNGGADSLFGAVSFEVHNGGRVI